MLVLRGEFSNDNQEIWTQEELKRHIVQGLDGQSSDEWKLLEQQPFSPPPAPTSQTTPSPQPSSAGSPSDSNSNGNGICDIRGGGVTGIVISLVVLGTMCSGLRPMNIVSPAWKEGLQRTVSMNMQPPSSLSRSTRKI
ncbi:hypothetical protein QYE76_041088 [Lolium multiflorum]|uniref:Uncharacterized protein n=1 Tax=Lolium multiflorum TaxID=4521 RepID=A0AAD8TC85_LOLMU|nr:hypothetical protein QYE76_041088 [Lolium multiflorum]